MSYIATWLDYWPMHYTVRQATPDRYIPPFPTTLVHEHGVKGSSRANLRTSRSVYIVPTSVHGVLHGLITYAVIYIV